MQSRRVAEDIRGEVTSLQVILLFTTRDRLMWCLGVSGHNYSRLRAERDSFTAIVRRRGRYSNLVAKRSGAAQVAGKRKSYFGRRQPFLALVYDFYSNFIQTIHYHGIHNFNTC